MSTRSGVFQKSISYLVLICVVVSCLFASNPPPAQAQASGPGGSSTPPAQEQVSVDGAEADVALLSAKAEKEGSISVIAVLDAPVAPVSDGASAEAAGMEVVAQAQEGVMNALAGQNVKNVYKYQYFPFMVMSVDAAALKALASAPGVLSVEENTKNSLSLADSTPLIGATEVWDLGYDGTGQTAAILDTGVDKAHPFLAGKVVKEGCFSGGAGDATTVCPNGLYVDTSVGSGVPCTVASGCLHGTHVAGITAGRDYAGGPGYSGVAKGANIIAVQVFSSYGGDIYTWDSDYINGLQYVYGLSPSYSITSVNMSLGGGYYKSACDHSFPAVKKAIDALRKVNIATVIASGNNGYTSYISKPACISSAISVGSTNKSDQVSSYSNYASILDLLAPGQDINSSIPGGGYETLSGTSMATPHVTGAWAVYRQYKPTASVSSVLSVLQSTGQKVKDWRNGKTKPRIDLANLFGKYYLPAPVTPALLAPGDGENLVNSTPVYQWSHVPLAYRYQLTAKRGTRTVLNKTYYASQICDRKNGICQVLPDTILPTGTITWYVKPSSMKGAGMLSGTRTFNTPLTVPAAVTLNAPTGSYTNLPPDFSWTPGTPMGDKYKVEIWKDLKKVFSKTYAATQICDLSGCDLPAPITMLAGNYTWTVTPWNPVGYSLPTSTSFFQTYPGFDSEFNGDHTNWTVRYSTPDWFQNSTYFYTWYGANYTWSSISYDAYYTNTLDYSVSMARQGSYNQDYSNSIVIQGNPVLYGGDLGWKAGYIFNYTQSGYISVWKVSNGHWSALKKWTYSPYVYTGSGYLNKLRVIYNNGSMYYYINDVLVWSGKNTSMKYGMVGVKSFVPSWYYDYLYVDWATLTPTLSAAAPGGAEMQSGTEEIGAEMLSPADGSPAGLHISMAEYESLMARQPQPLTPEQTQARLQACLEKGYDFCQEKPAQ